MKIGPQHIAVKGVQARRIENPVFPAHDPQRHQCRLSEGRAAVIHGCVRDVHTRELTNSALVFVHGLKGSLADFGLIRGVSSVEFRPRYYVKDRLGNVMVVSSAAGKEDQFPVPPGDVLEKLFDLHLRQSRWQLQLALETRFFGDFPEEFLKTGNPYPLEHLLLIFIGEGKEGMHLRLPLRATSYNPRPRGGSQPHRGWRS